MPTITIQHGVSGGVILDTHMLEAQPNNNFHASPHLFWGRFSGGARPLFDIDLTPLAGMTIVSARLELYVTNAAQISQPQAGWLERFLRSDWAVDEATWNQYRNQQDPDPESTDGDWDEPGCGGLSDIVESDYTQANRVAVMVPDETGPFVIEGLGPMVSDALATPYQRLLLRGRIEEESGETNAVAVAAATESTTLEQHPKLVVEVGEPINGGGGGINQSATAFPAASSAAFPAAWRQ